MPPLPKQADATLNSSERGCGLRRAGQHFPRMHVPDLTAGELAQRHVLLPREACQRQATLRRQAEQRAQAARRGDSVRAWWLRAPART